MAAKRYLRAIVKDLTDEEMLFHNGEYILRNVELATELSTELCAAEELKIYKNKYDIDSLDNIFFLHLFCDIFASYLIFLTRCNVCARYSYYSFQKKNKIHHSRFPHSNANYSFKYHNTVK